jgi:hypothetical protein
MKLRLLSGRKRHQLLTPLIPTAIKKAPTATATAPPARTTSARLAPPSTQKRLPPQR